MNNIKDKLKEIVYKSLTLVLDNYKYILVGIFVLLLTSLLIKLFANQPDSSNFQGRVIELEKEFHENIKNNNSVYYNPDVYNKLFK